jgi:CheY-like chemotaxis protein
MDVSFNDPKITNKHKLIFNNASRLLRLVNQIIEFRKAELNKLELNVAETEIIAFVEELFQSFQTLATEKKLRYKFKTNQNQFAGWIDQDKLERIVFNLLSNAFKFTEHGQIVLEIKILDKNMEICVSDTGAGIPQSKQQHIFERFYQVNHHVKYNTGSGIGLSLVKSLVELHHGKIWFESKEGSGSTFYVTIPVSKESYSEEELFKEKNLVVTEKKEVVELEKLSDQPTFECKVLVIEDNAELKQYLVDSLAENFNVYSASNGLEGIEKVRDVQPDIVVSDIMMEKMDGFEFCKRLKSDSEISHIPVILLTALTETEHQKEGYKIGADDYILKPFDPSLLQIRINNILENRKKIKKKYSSDPDLSIESLSHSAADDDFV